jgi:hypothetical protein
MSYFTKLIRIPNHQNSPFDHPQKPRSRSLDVEALERSGVKMLRVVMKFFAFSILFVELIMKIFMFFSVPLSSINSNLQHKVSTIF